MMNVPPSTVVFVPNATTGTNTVLRNIVWEQNDEIIYFSSIYGACGKTVEYICEANHDIVRPRQIKLTYPIEDKDVLSLFKDAIKTSRAQGKTPRLAIFDTVSALPGVRVPFEDLTTICREEGIYSMIDAAHAIGHVPLDLAALDPDFFVSNCHKWLFVACGCAVFYVPEQHQHMMRSTIPTSHGFIPRAGFGTHSNPLPPSSKSKFVKNFEFVGSVDSSNYACVAEAIKWRDEVCGGEKSIIEYNKNLALEGGKVAAKILGTEILDNSTHTLTDCCLVNFPLPLKASAEKIPGMNTFQPEDQVKVIQWMFETMMEEYKTYIPILPFQGGWWARLSGQVYLDMADFEWAGHTLKELCERVGRGEYAAVGKEVDDKGEAVEGGDLAKDGQGAIV